MMLLDIELLAICGGRYLDRLWNDVTLNPPLSPHMRCSKECRR